MSSSHTESRLNVTGHNLERVLSWKSTETHGTFYNQWRLFNPLNCFLFLIGVSLLATPFTRLGWVLSISLFVFLVYLYLTVSQIAYQLRLSRIVPSQVTRDSQFSVTVPIRNRSWFSLQKIRIIDTFSGDRRHRKALVFHRTLNSTQSQILSYKWCADSGIGKQTFGPMILELWDPLGVFCFKVTDTSQGRIEVFPKHALLPELPLRGSDQALTYGEQELQKSGISNMFSGVREYRTGEPLKHVSWRLSARHNKLMVKEFDRSVNTFLTLYLDLDKQKQVRFRGNSTLESVKDIGSNLAAQQANQSNSLQLISQETRIPFGVGRHHVDMIIQSIAALSLDGVAPTPLSQYMATVPTGSTLVYVAPVYMGNFAADSKELLRLVERGIQIFCFLIEAGSFVDRSSFESMGHFLPPRQKRIESIDGAQKLKLAGVPVYILEKGQKIDAAIKLIQFDSGNFSVCTNEVGMTKAHFFLMSSLVLALATGISLSEGLPHVPACFLLIGAAAIIQRLAFGSEFLTRDDKRSGNLIPESFHFLGSEALSFENEKRDELYLVNLVSARRKILIGLGILILIAGYIYQQPALTASAILQGTAILTLALSYHLHHHILALFLSAFAVLISVYSNKLGWSPALGLYFFWIALSLTAAAQIRFEFSGKWQFKNSIVGTRLFWTAFRNAMGFVLILFVVNQIIPNSQFDLFNYLKRGLHHVNRKLGKLKPRKSIQQKGRRLGRNSNPSEHFRRKSGGGSHSGGGKGRNRNSSANSQESKTDWGAALPKGLSNLKWFADNGTLPDLNTLNQSQKELEQLRQQLNAQINDPGGQHSADPQKITPLPELDMLSEKIQQLQRLNPDELNDPLPSPSELRRDLSSLAKELKDSNSGEGAGQNNALNGIGKSGTGQNGLELTGDEANQESQQPGLPVQKSLSPVDSLETYQSERNRWQLPRSKKRKWPVKLPKPELLPKSVIEKLVVFIKYSTYFAIVLLFVYFLFRIVVVPAEQDEERQVLNIKSKRALHRRARQMNKIKMAPDEEVLKWYNLMDEYLELSPFPRPQHLPPSDYEREAARHYFPLAQDFKVVTEVFCDVLYGQNQPQELKQFRRSVRKIIQSIILP